MNYRERLLKLLEGNEVDRPPFMPAIYDLKPDFINAPLHTFAQTKNELVLSLTFEAEELQAEALTVGYDIYNIEAEAVGCKILRNVSIGMPEIEAPLIQSFTEIEKLPELNKISGRMPLFVEVTEKIQYKYGEIVPVRLGISGPFSMAAKIFPHDDLLLESILNPEKVIGLLKYCSRIIKLYLEASIKTGAGIVIFDSFVSPPMISPETYRELILPLHYGLFQFLKKNNVLQRTLIVGGNTSVLIPDFVKTGATQLLLDFNIPVEESREFLQEFKNMVFRVNLPPKLFISHDTSELKSYILNVLQNLKDCKNLIIGTGILPPNVPPKNILVAKKIIVDFYS